MITIPKPEAIKTLIMTSDADYHKMISFTMDGAVPVDFATWQFQAGAKFSPGDSANAFVFTITPSLVTVNGVQEARLTLHVDKSALVALFIGTDATTKKLVANLLYKQPGVTFVLLAAEMAISVERGTTAWI